MAKATRSSGRCSTRPFATRRLAAPILFVLLSTVSLYVIVDLTDHLDEMSANDPPLSVIVGYYWNLIPQAMMDVLPLALMIGVLILLTVLERQLELTALKAAGVSLYRLVVPILLVGALRKDPNVRWYAAPLAIIGAMISGWHSLIEWRPSRRSSRL